MIPKPLAASSRSYDQQADSESNLKFKHGLLTVFIRSEYPKGHPGADLETYLGTYPRG